MCGFCLTIILFFRKDFNFKIKLCDTLNAVRVFSLWFTTLTWCFVNARVSPGCTGSGYQVP